MVFPSFKAGACIAILGCVFLSPSGPLFGQAPAGPLPPSHPLPLPPPPPPAKKKPALESRKTLAGFWKLNNEESDDPGKKLEEARQTKADSGAGGGPGGGGGRVGVGYPPFPGGGSDPSGGGGRRIGGEDTGTSERIQEMVRPDYSQSITLKDSEVDVTDDNGRKLVYYTDGRKIQKSKDDSFKAVSAHWDGTQLVTEEKGPQGRKMTRALELSPDGKHFYETWHIENGKSGTVIIRYVYDAASEYQ